MPPRSGSGLAVLAGCLIAAGLSTPTSSARTNDPLFPGVGSTAYDVRAYDVDLRWEQSTGGIDATARLTARSKKRLATIRLDLSGLRIMSIDVDGRPASYRRSGTTVVIDPARDVAARERFTVTIAYDGVPASVRDPDGSREGWLRTDDGVVVLGEPVGAMTWLPSNNRPGDKARLRVAVDVPTAYVAASNGRNTGVTEAAGRRIWSWDSAAPIAPHLATIAIGRYARTTETVDGVRYDSFVAPGMPDASQALDLLPRVVSRLERWFGPYPFQDGGIIVDDVGTGYALELQNRPYFPVSVDEEVLVHEMAHQWFGNSVTLGRWHHIWLNEGFATYAEWLWEARSGGRSLEQRFRTETNRISWSPAPLTIAAAELFDLDAVYTRGALTLNALRERIGSRVFFKLLKSWARENRYGTVVTSDFERLAERLSGRQLDTFFDQWLRTERRPRGL